LRGIRCPTISWDRGHAILSCPDAIASVLDNYLKEKEPHSNKNTDSEVHKTVEVGTRNVAGQCPECASLLVYQEGCLICPACGYTKC